MRPSNKSIGSIVISIGLLAAIIIIKSYFDDRSMFLDEVNLSRNVVELDWCQLWSNLKYEQHAPPGYLFIQKGIIGIWGVSHFSFRLLSLVVVLSGLYLFIITIRSKFGLASQVFTLTLFGLSSLVMRYGTEAKQYGLDIFFSILIINVGFNLIDTKKQDYTLVGILGAIGIWFSMPIVFALTGLGLAMLFKRASINQSIIKECVVIGCWLLSFGALYFISLRPSIENELLSHFHSQYFFGNNESIGIQIIGLFSMFIGKTAVPIVFAMILLILGIFNLIKRNPKVAILLFAPILSMLLASAFGYYSLITRMVVFLIPNFLILVGFGIQYGLQLLKNNKLFIYLFYGLIGIVLINFIINESSIRTLYKPYIVEEGREAIEFVTQYDHPIYITHSAYPFFAFYSELIDNPIVLNQKYFKGDYKQNILPVQSWIKENDIETFIVLDIHTFGKELSDMKTLLNHLGNTSTIKEFKAAKVLVTAPFNFD